MFSTLNVTIMPPKKHIYDVAHKDSYTPGAPVLASIDKLSSVHDDFSIIKGKSIRDLTNGNNCVNDNTSNIWNKCLLYYYDLMESTMVENSINHWILSIIMATLSNTITLVLKATVDN